MNVIKLKSVGEFKNYLSQGMLIKNHYPLEEDDKIFLQLSLVSNLISPEGMSAPHSHMEPWKFQLEMTNEDRDVVDELLESYSIPEEIDKTIILFDIVEFSKNDNFNQLMISEAFLSLVELAISSHRLKIDKIINTGDGIYIIFDDINSLLPDFIRDFFTYFHKNNNKPDLRNEIHMRGAVNIGKVYEVIDKRTKGKNYIGEGMNDTERVISFIPPNFDDVLYISDSVFRKYKERFDAFKLVCLPHGRKEDKHGKIHRIYQVLI